MASTFTYNDAWGLAGLQWPRSGDTTGNRYALNMAIERMWLAYDWRGTVVEMPPVWMVAGKQDYGPPFYSVPSDFYGLREVYLVWLVGCGSPHTPLKVVENLERTSSMGLPKDICYRPSAGALRVHPLPPFGVNSPQYLIDGTYKKQALKISSANLSDTLFWDDIYFTAFVQAVAWAGLLCLGKRREAAEQEIVFLNALHLATSSAALEAGDPTIHPQEPLVYPNE